MARLLIHVEGQTEETFVNQVLAPHLYGCGYTDVGTRLLDNARQRYRRGGIRPWSVVRSDSPRHLKEDIGCLATTMVDYYGLPKTGAKGWPGRQRADGLPYAQKAATVEKALLEDVGQEMGRGFGRFIPFVVMHEFEGCSSAIVMVLPRGLSGLTLPNSFRQSVTDSLLRKRSTTRRIHTRPSE